MEEHLPKQPYFRSLDALRFFSFLAVFFSHTLSLPDNGNTFTEFILHLITLNYLGVPLFFTLSSFLITYRLLVQKNSFRKISLPHFYRNRILRIWPIYFVLIFVCFVIIPFMATRLNTDGITLPERNPFLFFYVNFYIINHGSNFTSALLILWSISIEEQFYLVWAPLIKFISQRWLPLMIFTLCSLSILFSYDYLYIKNNDPNNLAIHSIFILLYFCAGALVAIIGVRKGVLFTRLTRIPKYGWMAIYAGLPVLSFVVHELICVTILKSIFFGLIIFDQSFNEKTILHAGKSKFVNYLGKISYGLYIYHALMMIAVEKIFLQFFSAFRESRMTHISYIVTTLILTIIVAHLSFKLLESKLLRLKSY